MKKILCILLAITMLFGLCACGKEITDNPEPLEPNENQTDTDNKQENVSGLKFGDFFYDVMDWDKLEAKESVNLKLCGISDAPFNVVDFKNNITEFDAFHIYTKEAENILDNLFNKISFSEICLSGFNKLLKYCNNSSPPSNLLKI